MNSLRKFASLLLLICFAVSAFAQSVSKTVVITKSKMDANGNQVTETITKTGEAALNFNLNDYLESTKDELGTLSIVIDDSNGNKQNIIIQKGDGNNLGNLDVEQDVIEIDLPDLAPMGERLERRIEVMADDIEREVEEAVEKHTNGEPRRDRRERRIIMRDGVDAPMPPCVPSPGCCKPKPGCCQPKGFMGVMPGDIQDGEHLSISLVKDGAAMKAGLQEDDILLKIADRDIQKWEDVTDFMKDTKPGQKVKVVVLRDKKEKKYEFELGNRQGNEGFGSRMEQNFEWIGENGEEIVERLRRNKKDSWSMKVDRDCGDNDVVLGVITEIREENINGERTRTGVSDKGFLIGEVVANSAAEKAGLQEGDIITKIGNRNILNYDDLKSALRQEKPNNVIIITYLRNNATMTASATLQPCKKEPSDIKSKVIIKERGSVDKERKIITIQRVPETVPANPQATQPRSEDQKLKVAAFKAYPNPTASVVNVEFEAAPAPTTITLFDAGGRQLYQEELNAFDGKYSQQFDLSKYAKGLVIIQLSQDGKVYSEQIIIE